MIKLSKFVFFSVCILILVVRRGYSKGQAVYTSKEKSALVELRNKSSDALYRDYMKDDMYLIRWLRAREMDVDLADKMIRKAHDWRRKNNIDSILNETILEFRVPPFYADGFSYFGRPVGSLDVGRINVRQILLSGNRNKFLRLIDQYFETGEAGLRYINNVFKHYEISQGDILVDLSGYNIRQHGCIACLSVRFVMARHIENYYPGLLKNLIFINTPGTYVPVLRFMKSALSSQTLKAVRIYGRDRNEWGPEVSKIIPPNQLRRQFGGTKPEKVYCPLRDFSCTCEAFFKSRSPCLGESNDLEFGEDGLLIGY